MQTYVHSPNLKNQLSNFYYWFSLVENQKIILLPYTLYNDNERPETYTACGSTPMHYYCKNQRFGYKIPDYYKKETAD